MPMWRSGRPRAGSRCRLADLVGADPVVGLAGCGRSPGSLRGARCRRWPGWRCGAGSGAGGSCCSPRQSGPAAPGARRWWWLEGLGASHFFIVCWNLSTLPQVVGWLGREFFCTMLSSRSSNSRSFCRPAAGERDREDHPVVGERRGWIAVLAGGFGERGEHDWPVTRSGRRCAVHSGVVRARSISTTIPALPR